MCEALCQLNVVNKNLFFTAGSEGYPLQFIDGTIPDVIYLPGTVTMDLHALISQDLPADVMIKLNLKKLEPFPLDVPCLDGLGSW